MPLWITEDQVKELLPMRECLQVLEELFRQAGEGQTLNQPRSRIRMPQGLFHLMSGATGDSSAFGLKAYTTFPGPSQAMVLLYDGVTGQLLAILEATHLGQIRTGAASGVATKYMARPDATTLGIIGTGYQARSQVAAVCGVRPIQRVRCYSRKPENREAFAEEMAEALGVTVAPVATPEECVDGVDIVVTVTNSRRPVFPGEALKEGVHINAAGSNHWMRQEVDETTVRRCTVIVVDDLTQAKKECGDLLYPLERGIIQWEQVHELKEMVAGHVNGRPHERAITLFESQGVAIEDVAAALHVYRKAREIGVGVEVPR